MVTCSTCGKVIEKIPDWLTGVTVQFVCNNCPNRQVKAISFALPETPAAEVDEDETDVEETPDEDED